MSAPVPCGCGQYLDELADDVSHCAIHHANEPVPPHTYRVCGECLHVYETPEALIETERHIWEEWGLNPPGDWTADNVPCCPLCVHDW